MKKNVGFRNNNNSKKKRLSIKTQSSSDYNPINLIKINNINKPLKISDINYDENFISLINQLSLTIKSFYNSNNSNISLMKNTLENNKMKNKDPLFLSNSVLQIEKSINEFYSVSKSLFQRIKGENDNNKDLNKSIEYKKSKNKEINFIKKNIKKDKSSLSRIKDNNLSQDQINYDNISNNRPYKNNSLILSNFDNIYNDMIQII